MSELVLQRPSEKQAMFLRDKHKHVLFGGARGGGKSWCVRDKAKRLCLLRHREGAAAALILLHLRKGGKPGLKLEEIALHDKNGMPTEAYRKIYHIEEA